MIYGNSSGILSEFPENVDLTFSLVEGKTDEYNGNINGSTDTKFKVDYSLQAGSPLINKGNNSFFAGLNSTTSDIFGNPRVYQYSSGGVIDIGASEYQGLPIMYVKVGGTGDGSSWANAIGNLQTAIDGFGVAQVWVAKGTYQPAVSSSFIMKNNVAIYGGFNDNGNPEFEDRNWKANQTTLKGNGSRIINNNFTVSDSLFSTAILDGFTITQTSFAGNGAAIYNNYASPSLNNLIISGNTSSNGGGIYNLNSSPLLSNTLLTGNLANACNGGGIYNDNSSPQSLIERVEVVKGPASTLYGSEAVGGLINIITKKPLNAPAFSADVFTTSWGEINTYIAAKFKLGKNTQSLIGLNYFNYSNKIDKNNDGFTDVTLQNRISIFNKWNFQRKDYRLFSLAARYVYEDRWGGEMNWDRKYRGGDSIYGESIYTSRWEFFGTYELPVKEKIMFQFSANGHDQNSVYGSTLYLAKQYVGFGQFTWNKQFKNNDLLFGATFRYTYYDDNTPATANFDTVGLGQNMASNTYLPGMFLQNEIAINKNNKLLLGMRYDYNSIHGSILTPRLNYKWNSKNKNNVLRFGIGNGYRVANVFTEDHAALTGSRKVEFLEDLNPEKSWNGNINFVKKIYTKNKTLIGLDATVFYTYFNNKIIADYETNPNKIIYKNLSGYAISQGVSLNLDLAFKSGLKFLLGGTYMDVYSVENGLNVQQLFSENFTGVWNVGYAVRKCGLTIDYTGNIYSPMRLPLLSANDPRTEYSPWWSIQNIQFTKRFKNGFEIYSGIKNILNWTPNKGNPFIIARSKDPFNKNVEYNTDGQPLITADNPYGLTFDPTYVYGPNQGIRAFLGFRYNLK
ncbi:MAG: TonB-dependent receptor [Ferruginibacter sp.]